MILKETTQMKYACDLCGWEYDEELGDPENGIEPGTPFEELPDDFVCPLCGAPKDEFVPAE
jgi:rubredoxin-NAD+ reductase